MRNLLRRILLRWIQKLESQEDDTDIEEIVKGFNGLSNRLSYEKVKSRI